MKIRFHKDLLLALMLLLTPVASVSVAAQTSDELRKKYGEPVYVRLKGAQPKVERYIARPGIALTATFTEAGHACEWLIEPLQSATANANEDSEQLMPTQVVKNIIDELVPKNVRGEKISVFHVNGGDPKLKLHHPGCTGLSSTRYEHVTINIVSSCEGGVSSAVIHWGITQCPEQRMQVNKIQAVTSRLTY